MDKIVLETFCEIAKNLSKAKILIATSNIDKKDYIEVRELLGDCIELMAIKADTSPIKLISGEALNG